ncbi:hypothetical protein [Pseudoduganella sp. HUAS MS19]
MRQAEGRQTGQREAPATSLGYQAIAFDMPPFGSSIPPESGEYGKQQAALA